MSLEEFLEEGWRVQTRVAPGEFHRVIAPDGSIYYGDHLVFNICNYCDEEYDGPCIHDDRLIEQEERAREFYRAFLGYR